jgi:hippurate hydrolase
VLRLQTLVSREIPGEAAAVLTVGVLRAGTKANIISDRAELLLNVRTYDPAVRRRILAGITRIVQGEAQTAGAARAPDVETFESVPAVINDAAGSERTRPALESVVGAGRVIDPGLVTGSEDVGLLAIAADAPCVFWLLGGADPTAFAGARDTDGIRAVMAGLPSNHSPAYAPVPDPTLRIGVQALVAAAGTWLGDH